MSEDKAWDRFKELLKTERTKEPSVPKLAQRLRRACEREGLVDPTFGHFVRVGLSEIASAAQSRDRQSFDRFIPGNARRTGDVMAAAGTGILETYIVGGVKLGDCTRGDLRSQALHLEAIAAGAAEEARFQKLVADRLPDDKTAVRKVLTDGQIMMLKHQAKHGGEMGHEANRQNAPTSKAASKGKCRTESTGFDAFGVA